MVEMLLKIFNTLRSDNQYLEKLYKDKDSRLRKVVGEYSAGISIQSSIIEIGGVSVIFIIPVLFILLTNASSDISNISIPLICTVKSIPYFNQLFQKNTFMRAYHSMLSEVVDSLSEIRSHEAVSNDPKNRVNGNLRVSIMKDWQVIQFNNIRVDLGDNKTICYPSFSVERNSKTAIVGGIGKGKTTLLDIIAGFRYQTKGTVLIDGQPIDANQYSNEISAICSYLALKSFIINGSLRYNIVLGNPYEKSQFDSAVSLARLHKIHLTDPNVIIGSSGIQLSGGQEKKVSLWALYENKDILILDEPTSAFDKTTANDLMETINSLDDTTILCDS